MHCVRVANEEGDSGSSSSSGDDGRRNGSNDGQNVDTIQLMMLAIAASMISGSCPRSVHLWGGLMFVVGIGLWCGCENADHQWRGQVRTRTGTIDDRMHKTSVHCHRHHVRASTRTSLCTIPLSLNRNTNSQA